MNSPEVNKVRKRSKVACLRCSSRKVKCCGSRPSCSACIASKHGDDCNYPVRPRKILIKNTDLEKMEERIRLLEAECASLKGMTKSIEMKRSICNHHRSREDCDCKYDPISLATPNEFRLTKPTSKTMTGLQIPQTLQGEPRTPDIEPSVPSSSSCRMFLGALCHQLISKLIPPGDSDSAFHENLITNEQDEVVDQTLFLDDKILNRPQAAPLLILPKKSYALRMVSKVFHFFAREYGLFSIADFEARIEDTYRDFQSQDYQWLAYLFITLAVGEQYTNKTGEHRKIPGMNFFLMTLQIFHEPLEEPTVDSVRTLLLIAFYSQGLNRMNSVFTYTGLAVSTAMILGMHRRISYAGFSKQEAESRRKLWWTACIMDSLWASRLSLPPHFNTEDMDVELPNLEMSEKDGFAPRYLIANVQLALCVGSVMKEVYGISDDNNFLKNIVTSVERLESFFDHLDPALKVVAETVERNRSTENLHLRYNQMIIVTVRPLYLSMLKERTMCTPITEDLVLKCVDAALLNINILINLFNSGWYSAFGFLEAQCCFSSILILVMETLNGRSFPELPIALSLNAYMSSVGNITAMNNHERLKELDRILFEAEKQKFRDQDRAAVVESSSSPTRQTIKIEKVSSHTQQQSPLLPSKEDFTPNDITAAFTSSGENTDLPFLVDLENSGIIFEQFSPNTLDDLSLNFQKWGT